MFSPRRLGVVALCCVSASTADWAGCGEGAGEAVAAIVRPVVDTDNGRGDGAVVSEDRLPGVYALDGRRVVKADGSRATERAGAGGKVVYSNTLGEFAASIPSGGWIADDLALLTDRGCALRSLRFEVIGKADPNGIGGAFRVEYAVFDNCPQAGGQLIRDDGRTPSDPSDDVALEGFVDFGEGEDSVVQSIEVVVPKGRTFLVPPMVWLRVRADRANVGVVFGAPAQIGFSNDVFDFPLQACNADAGGFPWRPHASFNTEVTVDAACPEAYPAYHNIHPGRGGFSEGRSECMADDLELNGDGCLMAGYEVGVRGIGSYRFALRRDAGGAPGEVIEGSERFYFVPMGTAPGSRALRFTFDPPIAIPRQVWMTFQASGSASGWILTRMAAQLGETETTYARSSSGRPCAEMGAGETGGWQVVQPSDLTAHGGFHARILCAGLPAMGACCDMLLTDDKGDSVCREVARMHCIDPLTGLSTLPGRPWWVEGAACDEEPFEHSCGLSACCKPDDACENLTQSECEAVEPIELPRGWQRGRFCEENSQECPPNWCLRGQGGCDDAHEDPGCEDYFCCADVCEVDPYCCRVEWDRACADLVNQECWYSAAPNDSCAPTARYPGAERLEIPSSTIVNSLRGGTSADEPGFCCDIGFARECTDDTGWGSYACGSNRDCSDDGVCTDRVARPGMQGDGTVWYKFIATRTSVELGTHFSADESLDTLIQVFAVGDATDETTSCNSLIPIACNDDSIRRDDPPSHARICVDGLTLGQMYYAAVATKSGTRRGEFRLNISAPCTSDTVHSANDHCEDAIPLESDDVEFELNGSTAECPLGTCNAFYRRDVWYEYVSQCTGPAMVELLSPSDEPFMGSIAVYRGCGCPADDAALLGCASLETAEPSLRTAVSFDVDKGECYTVRVGSDSYLSGRIVSRCVECPRGPVFWFDPPDGVIDARRPLRVGWDCIPWECNWSRVDEGIDSVLAIAPSGAAAGCWQVCETRVNGSPLENDPVYLEPNEIVSAEETQPGVYTVRLRRPITPEALTTISYFGGGAPALGRFRSHPGNVDGSEVADERDVEALVGCCLRGSCGPGSGMYSCDIDHSGGVNAADIPELIDLLNRFWMGTPVPATETSCLEDLQP